MPTETFKKLDQVKQNHIIEAAKGEFSRKLLKDASINQIIKDAGIPRGSFYMYFKDIEDIYSYILEEMAERAFKMMEELLTENKGDLFSSFLSFFDRVLNLCSKDVNKDFFRNVFLNMNLYVEEKTRPSFDFEILAILEAKVDKTKLSDEVQSQLTYLYHMLLRNVMDNVMLVVHCGVDKMTARHNLEIQFSILKNGIYRKGEEKDV